MKYFYHYTTSAGLNGIAGTCEVKKSGQFFGDAPEEGRWRLKENQPQKNSWYTDQHTAGFYLTDLSPDDLAENDKQLGKLGIGKLHTDEKYVFIFLSDDGKTLQGGEGRDEYTIYNYKNTSKYYIKAKKKDEGDSLIYLSARACFWCGPLTSWNNVKGQM